MNPLGDLLSHVYEHASDALSDLRRNQEGRLSVHPGSNDIYHAARNCETAFKDYLSEPRQYIKHVQDLQLRFSSWVNFLRVFAAPSLCLDTRLAGEPALKELLISMLLVLEENLRRGIIRHSQETHVTRENDVPMAGVTGAMERLARLALLIRVPSKSDEVQRVLKSRHERAPDGFDKVVLLMISFLYGQTEPGWNIADSLKIQLTSSVSYRRDRLLYNAFHDRELSKDQEDGSISDTKSTEVQPSSLEVKEIRTKRSPARSPSSSTTTSSQSQAAKGDVTHLPELDEHETNSLNSATRNPVRVSKYPYPDAPIISEGKSKARCQFCRELLSEKVIQEEWIEHVNEDLRPFICVSEDCGNIPPSFSKQHEWTEHMQQRHGRDWARFIHRPLICPLECDTAATFDDREELQEHLRQRHQQNDSKPDISLMTSCKKFREPLGQDICPICGPAMFEGLGQGLRRMAWPPADLSHDPLPFSMSNHIADHLISISFLSIRWWDVDVDDGSDAADNDSRNVAGSIKTRRPSDLDRISAASHMETVPGDQVIVPNADDLDASNGRQDDVGLDVQGVSDINDLWEHILNEKFGIQTQGDQEPVMAQRGLIEVYHGENARLDVVFLHVPRVSMENTWTRDAVLWPRDLLPRDFPETRVYLFRYDDEITHLRDQENATKTEIQYNADELCAALVAQRSYTNTDERPILFVAHSLGGLVAAQILVYGEQSHKGSGAQTIAKNLCGLIFLGTPLRGSNVAKPTEIARKVLESFGIDTQKATLSSLGIDYETLDELMRAFANVLNQRRSSENVPTAIQAFFFYETCKYLTLPFKIVEPESAQLPGLGDAVPIRANHHEICRFKTEKDDGYYLVVAAISKVLLLAASRTDDISRLRYSSGSYGTPAELGTASAVVGLLLETAISLVRTIQSARRQVKELPKTLSATSTQLEGLVEPLNLVKSEPTLQSASVMLQVEAIIAVAEELRDMLETLRKRQEMSASHQIMHAIASEDEDGEHITSIVGRVMKAGVELPLRIKAAQVGLIGTLNDGFRVASLTLAEVNYKVSSCLGTPLILATMTRGRAPNSDGNVALLQEELIELGLNDQPQPSDARDPNLKGQNIPEHNSRAYDNITLDQARIMTGDVGVEKWQNVSRVDEVAFNRFGIHTRVMRDVRPEAASAFIKDFWK